MKLKRAFTLIELLLVIAIVAIIFAFSAPYSLRFYHTQLINETQSNILSVLSQARHNALLQKNDSDWGVKFDTDNDQYVLFQGASYTEKVDLYDEVYPLLNNIGLTGDWTDEIIFSKYTGVPDLFGTTTIAYENMTRQIFIDEEGFISRVVNGGGGW
jgi:prepilin-type N-terminal cleavage/methylation domain-containing protein